jgi:hypothetical protein
MPPAPAFYPCGQTLPFNLLQLPFFPPPLNPYGLLPLFNPYGFLMPFNPYGFPPPFNPDPPPLPFYPPPWLTPPVAAEAPQYDEEEEFGEDEYYDSGGENEQPGVEVDRFVDWSIDDIRSLLAELGIPRTELDQ